MNETGINQVRKSVLMEALSELESEIDMIGGSGIQALRSSFKSVLMMEPPMQKDGSQKAMVPECEAIERIGKMIEKAREINNTISNLQERSQA